MASNFASSKPVILKDVRLQWGDLFTPGEGMNGGAPKFKVVGLWDKASANSQLAKAAMMEAATQHWGANAANMIAAMPANSKAVRDGNSKMDDQGNVRAEFKDMLYISAANKQKPQIVAPKMLNGKFVTITEDGRGFCDGMDVTDQLGYVLKAPYRGCYVNLKVVFIAGKAFKGNDGQMVPNQVYAKIEAVQFLRDGEPFGAGPTSAEGFGDEEVPESEIAGSELF